VCRYVRTCVCVCVCLCVWVMCIFVRQTNAWKVKEAQGVYATHTFSVYVSLSHTHYQQFQSPFHEQLYSIRNYTHTRTHSYAHTHTHTHIHPLSSSNFRGLFTGSFVPFVNTHTHTQPHPHPHSRTLSRTHKQNTQVHTHTHTHSLSLSLTHAQALTHFLSHTHAPAAISEAFSRAALFHSSTVSKRFRKRTSATHCVFRRVT